ncbi:hypothetical protein [Bradyrhizobium liaoningense]
MQIAFWSESALEHDEWRKGIAACACANLGRSGEFVGAIGMSGPDTRVKPKQIKEYSVHVMEAARTGGGCRNRSLIGSMGFAAFRGRPRQGMVNPLNETLPLHGPEMPNC